MKIEIKKRQLILLLILINTISTKSQKIELHYDFRKSLDSKAINDYGERMNQRNYLSATWEQFILDKWGETFMFADIAFDGENGNIGMAYTEISRRFNIGSFPLKPHLEFNGGVGSFGTIPAAYLAGVSYTHFIGENMINLYAAYKYNNFKKGSHDAQITTTWSCKWLKNRIEFCGFFDFWCENKNKESDKEGKKMVILGEPQLWYNFTPAFSLGTEIRSGYNFFNHEIKIYPTLGIRYLFLN